MTFSAWPPPQNCEPPKQSCSGRDVRVLLRVLVILVAVTAVLAAPLCAQVVSILHSFGDGSTTNDGELPLSGVMQAVDGNFYGTTYGGGSAGDGTVFIMTPDGVATVLHSFGDGSVTNDGKNPYAGLVQATDGTFYGTTTAGGSAGHGTIFQITTTGTVTILHHFGDGSVTNDGIDPTSGLILASDGNFYGTTSGGGSAGKGTVYEMTPAGVLTILHSFGDGTVSGDGSTPDGSVIQAADGNLYGTTEAGGTASEGALFTITLKGVLTVLHSFGDGSVTNDGIDPMSAPLEMSDGSFYGTTWSNGQYGEGAVYQLSKSGALTTLHSFGSIDNTNDGKYPQAGLIPAANGDFLGTTDYGGSADKGVVFALSTSGVEATIHSFDDGTVADDGRIPSDALLSATDGNYYGTTYVGGSTVGDGDNKGSGWGTIFVVTMPQISSLDPDSAGAGGAQFTLTVHGIGFAAGSTVGWNGKPLTTSVVSAQELTATVPGSDLDSAGSAAVTVEGPGSIVSPSASFTVSNPPAPTLTAISPTTALAGSARLNLTVTGSGFVASSTVNWNETALPTTLVSATQLVAVLPATLLISAGTSNVTVVTPSPGGGTSSGAQFTIETPVPAISSILPTSAPAGSTRFVLTVAGSSFVETSIVDWNGLALPTTYVSAIKLNATVPATLVADIGRASISVTTTLTHSHSLGNVPFAITNPEPRITSLSPSQVVAGSQRFPLDVTGSQFVGGSSVRWNGSALPTVYVSSTKLTATVPASVVQSVGSAGVTVFSPSPGGGASSAMPFVIGNAAPILTSISPSSEPVDSARFYLTLTGAQFTTTSTVRWNGIALPTAYVSSSTLTAVVPATILTIAGSAAVTVTTPTPGGGTSATSKFTISN